MYECNGSVARLRPVSAKGHVAHVTSAGMTEVAGVYRVDDAAVEPSTEGAKKHRTRVPPK
ncbi:hypothetical protein D3C83_334870 [compost metagenome]